MLLSICLNFWKFQPSIVYKSVAYKKRVCFKTFVLISCFKMKKRIERLSFFPKFFLERITKMGAVSKMALKQTVQIIQDLKN